ncbi:MAG: hypothetical protein DRR00_28080 [Candidatus Parabeggiatoa sp. nov. 3]|nr:MAG: hypothetical protein DRR00_28080 [Gammaproteobacteria bacterium]RKZ58027.1 MAG: hypothetical protein DRQ99_26040 [Gammaproteobacteria bacterium]
MQFLKDIKKKRYQSCFGDRRGCQKLNTNLCFLKPTFQDVMKTLIINKNNYLSTHSTPYVRLIKVTIFYRKRLHQMDITYFLKFLY